MTMEEYLHDSKWNPKKWFKVEVTRQCISLSPGQEYWAKKDGDCRYWIEDMGSYHVSNFKRIP